MLFLEPSREETIRGNTVFKKSSADQQGGFAKKSNKCTKTSFQPDDSFNPILS